jgi:hypothetical protein
MLRWVRQAAAAVVAAAVIATAGPAVAAIATGPGPAEFSLAPAAAADGQQRGYFTMTVAPDASATDVVMFINNSAATERLRVGVTEGVTALNSGSAYTALGGACTGAACWVTGLPATVTLLPRTQESVRFGVRVPAHTKPAQYLAGITASPVTAQSAAPKSNGRTRTRVIVVERVIIGVAVTVGKLSALPVRTKIAGVTASWIDGLVRLNAEVANTGKRFTSGSGTLACSLDGATRSYRLSMDTVLPGQDALLAVNGTGMHSGTWNCTVTILATDSTKATWTGNVTVPAEVAAATKRIGNDDYVAPSEPGIPGWAIVLMVLGGFILFSIWALILRRNHDRNRGKHADT